MVVYVTSNSVYSKFVILSIHQPSFKMLSTIDGILLLSKGIIVHQGTLSSLQIFLLSNGFIIPPQLNALEYVMEILNHLQDNNNIILCPTLVSPYNFKSSLLCNNYENETRYRSLRFHEIFTLYIRFCKISYRTKQLLLTNTL